MKSHKSTREENKKWANVYLYVALGFVCLGIWKDENFFFLASFVLLILALYRLLWLDKKLKEK